MSKTFLYILVVLQMSTSACNKGQLPPSPSEISRLQIRKNHQNLVPVGKSFVVMPLSTSELKAHVTAKTENILFLILLDGSPLDYQKDVRILMYAKQGDAEPLYSFTAQEWKKMHQTTHCSGEVLSYINDSEAGDALFCNHSIDLEKVHFFATEENGKKGDTATSFSVSFEKPNLVAVSVTFD